MKNLDTDLILCDCMSSEHQIMFTYNEDEKEIYMSVHLFNYRSFFNRIWIALKYIFGYKCRFGHFDEVLLNSEDAEKFLKIYNFLKL